jgi:Fe-Mn family superoxide dismutase
MERRSFLKGTTLFAAATTISMPTFSSEKSSDLTVMNSFTYDHKPKPLSFKPNSKNGLSEKLIVSHWENNYGGSVKALNEIRKKLNEARSVKDLPPYVYNDLKREHLMRTGSVVNHEFYFDNLGGNGKASGKIEKLITQAFGDFEVWEEDFKKTAKGLGGGPGWVILGYNGHLKTLENFWAYDHMHGILMTSPLLILDMYEHSYHLDYGAAANKYIDAFFKNINWEVVSKRLEALS